jgi:hypothetical protein
LQKEWSHHESKKKGNQDVVVESPAVSKKDSSKNVQPILTSVLEPILCPVDTNNATMQQGSKIKPTDSSQ